MKHTGRFGTFGGFYVPEVLIPALEGIEQAFDRFREDSAFTADLDNLYKNYAGRPSPLYFAGRFSEHLGFKVYVKREDLMHGGAHKVNNTLGQGLLAKYMQKTKLIAETGAGQHGLATAMIGALFGMETKIFMGTVDIERQSVNVHKMKLCGAEVVPVSCGTGNRHILSVRLGLRPASVSDYCRAFPVAHRYRSTATVPRYNRQSS